MSRPVSRATVAALVLMGAVACAKMAARSAPPPSPTTTASAPYNKRVAQEQSGTYELQVEAKPASEGEASNGGAKAERKRSDAGKLAKADKGGQADEDGDSRDRAYKWTGEKAKEKPEADETTKKQVAVRDGLDARAEQHMQLVAPRVAAAAPPPVTAPAAAEPAVGSAMVIGHGSGGMGFSGTGSGGGGASLGRLSQVLAADTGRHNDKMAVVAGKEATTRGPRAAPEKPKPAVVADPASAVDLPADKQALDAAADDDGNGQPAAADACLDGPAAPAPMPKRCHLAPNYRAGTAPWQRKLQALATLPPALARQIADGSAASALVAPETTALAVDAQLDRDHVDGPGQLWLRVGLRSTDRWGMRRPPFDLAVVVGAQAAAAPDRAACKALEALAERIEPQDRLTFVRSDKASDNLDGIAGVEAAQRIRDLCAQPSLAIAADLHSSHGLARTLLASHAAAQHRVAGTRVIVVVAVGRELGGDWLAASVAAGVQEPTLTSLLVLGSADDSPAWRLADVGHGLVQPALAGHEADAAAALWRDWGRVVARLVRVDIRLASNVVALQVVGSRALDTEETQRVRRQERAVDQNLARVAGVKRDRDQDGEGMTMLIPAFLGSDAHFIDVLLQVQGPGPVADVVVDYKDLVRMTNQKAAARASLERVAQGYGRVIDTAHASAAGRVDWAEVAKLQTAVQRNDEAEMRAIAAHAASDGSGFAELAQAMVAALAEQPGPAALAAVLELWIARAHGCRVTASPTRGS